MPYPDAFPDFDPATMPRIPAGFVDYSWKNDAMPSFVNEQNGLCIWVDYADRSLSEMGEDSPRFIVVQMKPDDRIRTWYHDDTNPPDLLQSNDWQEVVMYALTHEYLAWCKAHYPHMEPMSADELMAEIGELLFAETDPHARAELQRDYDWLARFYDRWMEETN